MRALLSLLILCGAGSQAVLVLETAIINCSRTAAIIPFIGEIDVQGHVVRHYKLNGAQPEISDVYGNVVSSGDDILAQAMDTPSDWPGARAVLARLDRQTLLVHERGPVGIELSENSTAEQKAWARKSASGHELPAVWTQNLGGEVILANHRTITFTVGLPNVRLDEWALVINASSLPYVGKLVHNTSQVLPGDQPLPPFFLGDERALDSQEGVLYVQACKERRARKFDYSTALAAESSEDEHISHASSQQSSAMTRQKLQRSEQRMNGNVSVIRFMWQKRIGAKPWLKWRQRSLQAAECDEGADIMVWDANTHKALRHLPMHGVAVHALHYDTVLHELRGILIAPTMNRGMLSEGSSPIANRTYSLVCINTTTGELQHRKKFSVSSALTLQTTSSVGAFDDHTGKLALLFVETTTSSDWSGGDPKSAWVLEISARHRIDDMVPLSPRKIDLLAASPECTSSAEEIRLYEPSLTYVEDPVQDDATEVSLVV